MPQPDLSLPRPHKPNRKPQCSPANVDSQHPRCGENPPRHPDKLRGRVLTADKHATPPYHPPPGTASQNPLKSRRAHPETQPKPTSTVAPTTAAGHGNAE